MAKTIKWWWVINGSGKVVSNIVTRAFGGELIDQVLDGFSLANFPAIATVCECGRI